MLSENKTSATPQSCPVCRFLLLNLHSKLLYTSWNYLLTSKALTNCYKYLHFRSSCAITSCRLQAGSPGVIPGETSGIALTARSVQLVEFYRRAKNNRLKLVGVLCEASLRGVHNLIYPYNSDNLAPELYRHIVSLSRFCLLHTLWHSTVTLSAYWRLDNYFTFRYPTM